MTVSSRAPARTRSVRPDARRSGDRLPVPVTPFGPMNFFAVRVHELNLKGRAWDALHAAEAFECVARLAGDERTVRLLTQGRMYAWQTLGRWPEALRAGERLLEMHRVAGDAMGEAKTLADLGDTLLRLSRLDEALHCLALSRALLEKADRRHVRYVSAVTSVAEAARASGLYELADETARTVMRIGEPCEAAELEQAENLIEWGLRLDHVGRHDEALVRFRRGAALSLTWVRRLEQQGTEADSPWARALLALALAKLGDIDGALAIAAPTAARTREQGQVYEARLAHLAYGIALRVKGDRPAARREFLAAMQLAGLGSPTMEMIIQYELGVLAALDCPEPAAGDMLAALRSHAQEVWRVRLQRIEMLRQAGRRLELEDARARADDQATRDALTGLGNRRAFDRQMEAVHGGAEPLTLLLVDLDCFKSINDRHSHSVGDQVLRDVAATLRAHCRQEDVPVRFGGDEFAVFVNADLTTAQRIGERVRSAVAERDWDDVTAGLRVTVSIGAARMRRGMTGRQLLDAADKRLYAAKHRGRNQLVA